MDVIYRHISCFFAAFPSFRIVILNRWSVRHRRGCNVENKWRKRKAGLNLERWTYLRGKTNGKEARVKQSSQVKVMLWLTVSRLLCLGVESKLGPKTRFLLLSDSWRVTDVGAFASAVIRGSESRETRDHIVLSQIRNSLTWRARSRYLYPPGAGWPGYTPGIGFLLRRLLQLAGLRCRYSRYLPRLGPLWKHLL
jgi:hypothetical protein